MYKYPWEKQGINIAYLEVLFIKSRGSPRFSHTGQGSRTARGSILKNDDDAQAKKIFIRTTDPKLFIIRTKISC